MNVNDDREAGHGVFISHRVASLALMLAQCHLEDGDCLGVAARDIYLELEDKAALPPDLDC